jgi:hypothetical protein
MKRSHLRGALALTFVSILVLSAAAPAFASAPSGLTPVASGHLGSIGIADKLPDGTKPISSDAIKMLAERSLDVETSLAITDIVMADKDRSINTVTWDEATDTVTFWAYGETTGLERQIAEALPSDQSWAVASTERPIAEVEKLIESIAYDPSSLPAGVSFVSGAPSEDGSTVRIGVTLEGNASLRSNVLPTQLQGVDVQYVEDELASLTGRSRTSAPIISGGQTWRHTGQGTCTQGFPVLRYQDSQPNTLTADHCTDAVSED